jgi:hypothetical protein
MWGGGGKLASSRRHPERLHRRCREQADGFASRPLIASFTATQPQGGSKEVREQQEEEHAVGPVASAGGQAPWLAE